MNEYLDKQISEMKAAASVLSEYSCPKVSIDDEKQISCLREREIFVDGYEITTVLSENVYTQYKMYTLQAYSSYGSFLPFSLVCKLVKNFLGCVGLYYVSVIQNDKKIYIWTLCLNLNGEPLEDKSYRSVKLDEYHGLKFYRVLNVDNSKFF